MFEWWTPYHDAGFVFVLGNLGTWLLVKYGKWVDGR